MNLWAEEFQVKQKVKKKVIELILLNFYTFWERTVPWYLKSLIHVALESNSSILIANNYNFYSDIHTYIHLTSSFLKIKLHKY